LKDVAVVMRLDELAPVGGRPASRGDRRRFERFAEVRENLPDRSGLGDEGDQPDVAAARWALERKLLPDPRHQFRPRNPRGVMRAGLLIRIRVTAASRGVTVVSIPAGRGLALRANVANRQRRDGFSQPVVRREYSVIAMPVLPRRRHEVRQTIEKLKRRELDDTIGTGPRGLAATTGADPGRGFVPRQHVADADDAAVGVADHGESLECEWGAGAVPEKMLKRLTLDTHLGR